MSQLDARYIDCIEIPDIQNGITEKNAELFDFPDSAYQLLGKKGMRILCVEVVLFMIWLSLRGSEKNGLFAVLTGALILLAVWYEREYRNVRIYKKARKGALSLAADYTLKMVNKLVQSRKIFFRDMPAVYSIKKAQALLREDNPVAADLLMEQLLEQTPGCMTAIYIRGLCAYLMEKDQDALHLLSGLAKKKGVDGNVKACSREICDRIKKVS